MNKITFIQVPSTVGMRRSVETSHLFKIRANDIVPENIIEIDLCPYSS